MSSPRVLFILKQRQTGPYGAWNYSPAGKPLSSGLSVSATEMSYALDELGIVNELVHVIDNNGIDREVTRFRPTHVIIEAFWVVPDKFDVLRKLHPTVEWIVRNHSKSDFLSHEGGMIGWAIDYIRKGVTLACNSPEAYDDFRKLAVAADADPRHVAYLPNYYRAPEPTTPEYQLVLGRIARELGLGGHGSSKEEMDIGCFGAIRPLKNTMHQAIAAIEVAQRLNKTLRFHINGTRIEGKADSILNSIRTIFKRFPQHELVELQWMEHEEFTEVVHCMDIVVQVSNSETFNIVAADAVANGVPVLVSNEIPWLGCEFHANPNNVSDIAEKLLHLWKYNGHVLRDTQLAQLQEYVQESKRIWGEYLTRT